MVVQQFHTKNQFVIHDDSGNTFFQSYNSVIAKIDKKGKIYLDAEKWDYSKTTGKYRNMFIGATKAETVKAIADGRITLTNLN